MSALACTNTHIDPRVAANMRPIYTIYMPPIYVYLKYWLLVCACVCVCACAGKRQFDLTIVPKQGLDLDVRIFGGCIQPFQSARSWQLRFEVDHVP